MSKMWGPKQMIRILLRIRRITWKEKCKTTTKTMNAMESTIMKTVRTKTARTNTTTAKTMATMTTNKTATKTKNRSSDFCSVSQGRWRGAHMEAAYFLLLSVRK